MRLAIPASILLGLGWNLIVVRLLGGGWRDALEPAWLAGGAAAGWVAGAHTIASRRRNGGSERLQDGLMSYYLAMVADWFVFVCVERIRLCIQAGGWTDFNLHDHLALIGAFLTFGTFVYGLLLIPLCFLTRRLVWRVHLRDSNTGRHP